MPKDPTSADGYSVVPLHAWSHSYSDLVQAAGALRAAGGIDIVLPSELLQRVADNVLTGATCACDTPGAGKAGHNSYTCSDGTKASCAASEACYATLRFAKGDWASGCGNPTPCDVGGEPWPGRGCPVSGH